MCVCVWERERERDRQTKRGRKERRGSRKRWGGEEGRDEKVGRRGGNGGGQKLETTTIVQCNRRREEIRPESRSKGIGEGRRGWAEREAEGASAGGVSQAHPTPCPSQSPAPAWLDQSLGTEVTSCGSGILISPSGSKGGACLSLTPTLRPPWGHRFQPEQPGPAWKMQPLSGKPPGPLGL